MLFTFLYLLIGFGFVIIGQLTGWFGKELTHKNYGTTPHTAEELGGIVTLLVLIWPFFLLFIGGWHVVEFIGTIFKKWFVK